MRIRKIMALTLALAAAAALMSGCHGRLVSETEIGEGIVDTGIELDETREIQLTFWAKNDTNKVQAAVYEQAAAEFQALYPNIKIRIKQYSDYGDIYADVLTNIPTDTPPNICITYPDHIATYMTGSDTVVQLDNWMRDSRYGLGGSELRFDGPTEAEIVPEFLQECVVNGHYYAMPYMRSTEALYINQDLVEKLGYEVPDVVTWDFIWEVSEKALEKNEDGTFKVNGQQVMIPFIYKSTDNMMITMLRQLGAPYSTDRGEVQIFNDTTAAVLQEIYPHARNKAFSTFKISSYPGNFMNRGQCIFAVDSTAGATWIGGDAPLQDIPAEQLISFRTVVRPVPQYDPEHMWMISQGPSICIFNREDEQEVLASWLFVQYLLTNRVQLAYAETEGYLPVTRKAMESAEYREYLSRKGEDNQEHYAVKIEASELLMNHTSETFVTPVFNGSTRLRSAAGELIESTCKTARKKKDMDYGALYSEIRNNFRLDEIQVKPEAAKTEADGADGAAETAAVSAAETRTQKEIPAESKALLIILPAIWILIGVAEIRRRAKDGKKKS